MPHTALTYWTSFSGSFPTWVSSLLCILAPLPMPSLLFSFVAAIVNLMVISSPCSTPLWRFMKVLRHSTPVLFCNSSASPPLQEDVHALEDCLRQALMNLPLPQALDFLHSQLLSSMCISPPVRKDNNPPAPFASPPLKRHFQWPSGTPDPPPDPPSFHVWITRKVAPHMAVVDLRCDAVPWACFRRGPTGQHQFGLHSGNFIQFVFPATDDYADCGFFSFALYITKVALKGRVVLENP